MNIKIDLLTPNKYSRPKIPLNSIKKIVLHYVGNPNTSAMANRNYFENQKCYRRYVSSHYIIGLDGEVIQCVPENEVAYCSNQANSYSISIECCHPDSSGKFTDATTESAIELCAYLLKKYNLKIDDLIRHYDVTGKQCPLWFVPTKYQPANIAEARWNEFKQNVLEKMVTKNATNATGFLTVKVIDDALNVRSGPGLKYNVVAVIRDHGIYTITKTEGSWGHLKSGVGWININDKYVKVNEIT